MIMTLEESGEILLYRILDLTEKILASAVDFVRNKMTNIILKDIKKSYHMVSLTEDYETGYPEIIIEDLHDNDDGWQESTKVYRNIRNKYSPKYEVLTSVYPNLYERLYSREDN